MLITDERALLLERLSRALEAGPGLAVQLRAPTMSDRARYQLGVAVKALCDERQIPLFVNGRLDLALTLGSHLHCTTRSLTPIQTRPFLPGRLISIAVHDGESAAGADFALVSPVFTPRSKPNDQRPTLGVEGFRRVASALPCPAFALGGIDLENARLLGGAPVATVNGVLGANDPRAAATELLRQTRRSC